MRGGERVIREKNVSILSEAGDGDGQLGRSSADGNSWNIVSMNKEVTICLRIDEETARRIERALGPGCPTRSRFIRSAIESALSQEDGRARLQSAYSAITWD